MPAEPPVWRETLRWAALTAAFIGPGTVTVAARAGSDVGLLLLWAVLAAILGCIVVQYAAACITRATGKTLPDLLDQLPGGRWTARGITASILFGCAAFQSGNLIGAAMGLSIVSSIPVSYLVLPVGGIAYLVLVAGNRLLFRWILGAFVLSMSLFFLGLAGFILSKSTFPDPAPSAEGLYLALALFGTTIVPYNLFLGSELARSAGSKALLPALALSVGTGGFITAGILICGTTLSGVFSFPAFADALEAYVPGFGAMALGTGLFAAGFSSALTAPFAAGLLAGSRNQDRQLVTGLVMVAGLVGASFGGAPAVVIVSAQTANALVLPLALAALAYFLWRFLPAQRLLLALTGGMSVIFLILGLRFVATLF